MNTLLARYNLSCREYDVIELVRKGWRNKEVANSLFITEKTVKFHLTNIYKKVGVKSRSQLIVKTAIMDNEPEVPMIA